MSIVRRMSAAIERLWAAYPLIGIVLLFAVLAFIVFQSYKARELAATAVHLERTVIAAQQETIRTKDATIVDQGKQLAAKDQLISAMNGGITKLVDEVVLLEGQVKKLGGSPAPFSVQIQPPGSTVTPTVTPASSPSARPSPSPTPRPSPTLTPAVVVQCPLVCPPTR